VEDVIASDSEEHTVFCCDDLRGGAGRFLVQLPQRAARMRIGRGRCGNLICARVVVAGIATREGRIKDEKGGVGDVVSDLVHQA